MKPSKFSTGDWFRLIGIGDCLQIEEVYTVEMVKGKRIMLGGRDHTGGYEFYYSDEIEPIPIDGEILKKNGFSGPDSSLTFTHSYGGSKEKTDEEEIVLTYDLTHNEWDGGFFGPKGRAVQVRIRYVHELQRIMRCMGIDHDIVV